MTHLNGNSLFAEELCRVCLVHSPCATFPAVVVVCPQALSPLQSLYLSFGPYLFHSLHFSEAGKGRNNLQKQCDICCPDSKWKGRQGEQAACGTGNRQT